MCGISGIVDLQAFGAGKHIAAMTSQMRHRGPDDEGYLLANVTTDNWVACGGDDTLSEHRLPHISRHETKPYNLAFGHRRLAILDLSIAGHGPMSSPEAALWITYNGEIYNYLELRAELSASGYRFQTATDTEVILAAYAEWGENCLQRFNGMWAFAIWDTRKKQIFCARDHFGIKPFYYFWNGELFLFASEIKALLAHPALLPVPNQAIIYDYLALGSIDHTTDTFFEGIENLPAAHYLIMNLERGALSVRRWWRLQTEPISETKPVSNGQDVIAGFDHLFTDALRLRLRSDVPVGTCLSGGVDSSSIVSVVNELLQKEAPLPRHLVGERQKTFSACFADPAIDERGYVKQVVEATGVASYQTFPQGEGGLWDELPRLVWHQDEPFGSTSIYSQWVVMRLAREAEVTVLLDGQGADELLGGYDYYFGPYLSQMLRDLKWAKLWRTLRDASYTTRLRGIFLFGLAVQCSLSSPMQQIIARAGNTRFRTNPTLSSASLDPSFARHFSERDIPYGKHSGGSSLLGRQNRDLFTHSLPALLRYEDRNSMAFSLEARVPFLDYRLVEYVFSLPDSYRIRDGWTKWILRQSMQGILPESIRWRRGKLGFATPQRRWLQEGIGEIAAIFNHKDIHSAPYLASKTIDKLRDRSKISESFPGLWRVVNLEMWFRSFFA